MQHLIDGPVQLDFKKTSLFGLISHTAEVTDGNVIVRYGITEWKSEFVLCEWVDDRVDPERRASFDTLAEAKRTANEWHEADV